MITQIIYDIKADNYQSVNRHLLSRLDTNISSIMQKREYICDHLVEMQKSLI